MAGDMGAIPVPELTLVLPLGGADRACLLAPGHREHLLSERQK